MTETERDYFLRIVQMEFSSMSARERRRMRRKHHLLYIALDHLSKVFA